MSESERAPATFVAFAVSTLFFGIVITQAVLYFRHYRRDRISLKLLVSVITVLQSFQQVLLSIYAWLKIFNNGVSEHSLRLVVAATLLIDVAIVVTAQIFNASRIRAFDPTSTRLVVACCTFVLGNMALSIVMAVKLVSAARTGQDGVIKELFIAVNAVTWSTDVLFSVIFVAILVRSRTGTSFGNQIRRKVIRTIVNTAIFTILWGIVALIVMIRNPHTNIPALLYMIGTNSYTMSLLCSLISRVVYKAEDSENRQPVEVELPEFRNPDTPAFSTIGPQVSSIPSEECDGSIKVSSEESQQDEVDES